MRYCSAIKMEGADYVPVGNSTIHCELLQNVPYRWKNEGALDEQFQILFGDEWLDAWSIDFEFND